MDASSGKMKYSLVRLLLAHSLVLVLLVVFLYSQSAALRRHTTARLVMSDASETCTEATTEQPELIDAPTFAPDSLRRYVRWHRSARECLASAECEAKPPVLVFQCIPGVSCGGLGDRFRGIHLTFLLAVMSRRVLLIDWPAGEHSIFPLTIALTPASIDWRLPSTLPLPLPSSISSSLRYAHSEWKLLEWSTLDNFHQLPLDRSSNLTIDLATDIIDLSSLPRYLAIATNMPHSVMFRALHSKTFTREFPDFNAKEMKPSVLLRSITQALFLPTQAVLHLAKPLRSEIPHPYISVHVRTGDDLNEKRRPRFKDMQSQFSSIAHSLLSCAARLTDGIVRPIFLASDSTRFKAEFLQIATTLGVDVHMLQAPALHVGRDNASAAKLSAHEKCQSFLNVFVDLVLLSKGDVIITTKSGFSKSAYYLASSHALVKGYSPTNNSYCKPENVGEFKERYLGTFAW